MLIIHTIHTVIFQLKMSHKKNKTLKCLLTFLHEFNIRILIRISENVCNNFTAIYLGYKDFSPLICQQIKCLIHLLVQTKYGPVQNFLTTINIFKRSPIFLTLLNYANILGKISLLTTVKKI